VERVIQSEVFKEELQEMVAQQISDSLQPAAQPLYDLISLRQRYGQLDNNSKYGMSAFIHLPVSTVVFCLHVFSTSLSISIAEQSAYLTDHVLPSVSPHMWIVAKWLIRSGCRLAW